MDLKLTTDRLILRPATPNDASDILTFYLNNQELFENYEATKPDNFYTLSMQENIIHLEQKAMLLSKGIRYYIFLKENPQTLIGTMSLSNMLHGAFNIANLGYKLDQKYHHMGYATEALKTFLIECVSHYKLHRIEAYILEDNSPSINLIKRLGFTEEGIAKEYALIKGEYRDMLRFYQIYNN